MKLILLALIISAPVMACPELGGLYRICKSSQGEMSKLRVVQSSKDNSEVYKISWSNERMVIHTADGVTRVSPIFDTGMALLSTATCEGDMLKRTLATKLANGSVSMQIEQQYTKAGDELHFVAIDERGVFKDIRCRP